MSEFNPYLKWLGIREPERPVNYYRLLGLDPFESDPEVISTAADRQMAHVRSYQTGPNGDVSQRIMSEMAIARRCLLDPAQKESYDQQMRMAMGVTSEAPATEIPIAVPLSPTEDSDALPIDVAADRVSVARRAREIGLITWLVVALVAIGLGIVLLASGIIPGVGNQTRLDPNDSPPKGTSSLPASQTNGPPVPSTSPGVSSGSASSSPASPPGTQPNHEPKDPSSPVSQPSAPSKTSPSDNPFFIDELPSRTTSSETPKPDSTSQPKPEKPDPLQPSKPTKPTEPTKGTDPTDATPASEKTDKPEGEMTGSAPKKGEITDDPFTPSVPAKPDTETEESPSPKNVKKIRFAPPSLRQQAAAQQQLLRRYKDDIKNAKTPSQLRPLFQKFLDDSDTTQGNEALQFVMLSEATNLAVRLGDLKLAMLALRKMNESFEVKFWELAEKAVEETSARLKATNAPQFITELDLLIEEAVDQQEFKVARTLANTGFRLARLASRKKAKEHYANLRKYIQSLSRLADDYQQASRKLKSSPADPKSHRLCGDFMLVIEKDVDSALEHWTQCDNPTLVAIAKLDSETDFDDVPSVIKLATGWMKAGEQSQSSSNTAARGRACLQQAKSLFEATLDETSGLQRRRIDSKIKAIDEMLNDY